MSSDVGRPRSGQAPTASLSADGRAAAARLLTAAQGLQALDRLAELAAALLGAAYAQVSMLTDVQTVAGGAALPPGVRDAITPLGESLCTVTAASGAPLVVADAPQDARVATLAPVASGAVGSYLGVPMIVAGGATVGALCVFNREGRTWSARDASVLEQLAEWAVTELEFAALATEFDADRQRWELSIDAAGIGSFDWDLRAGRVVGDARMRELFGVEDVIGDAPAAAYIERVHPDDVARVTAAIEEAVSVLGVYRTEHRVLLGDGRVRWVRVRGRVLGDERGKPVRLLGSVLDTTNEKDADARAVRVLESMSAAFVSIDRDWRLTYVNHQAEELLGLRREDVLGSDVWELFPLARGTVFEETYRRAVDTGQPQMFEAYYPAPLNAWYEIRALPSADGLAVYFAEVTARREAQELVALSHEVGERLSQSLDVDAGVRDLVRSVVPRLADWAFVSLVDEQEGLCDVAGWHADPALRDAVDRFVAWRLVGRDDESVIAEAVRTARPLVMTGGAMDAARSLLRADAAIAAVEELAPESVVALPLGMGDRRRGVLTLLRSAARPPMSEQEISVAGSIAQRAGLALDNARLYTDQRETAARLSDANCRLRGVAEHQRTVAQALQEAMLTRLPQPDHLELVARYLTASVDEQVGGDWYDAVMLPDGETLVSIGDVVGHDIHAAAIMGQLRNMLRMVAWDRDEPPAAIVARLDRAMRDLDIDTLATLLTLRIEQSPEEARAGLRSLRWTAAGHPAPVLVLADGTAGVLEQQSDLLLGCAPECPRRDNLHVAPPGSTLLLYTDGLIETRGRGIAAGQLELVAAAGAHHALPLDDLVGTLIDEMVGAEPADDVAVLAVRFHPEDRPQPAS